MNLYSVIFLILGVVFSLVGMWPFGPYQLSLIIARRLHWFSKTSTPKQMPASGETFAICLCAYNEAGVIQEKIDDLLQLRAANGGELDIAIYVDAANDGTAAILERYSDRIRLIVSPERRGKTHGMNLLVAGTDASIVLFTDANVRIDPSAISVLKRYFADPAIGCVCSNLHYVNAAASSVAQVGSAFWSFNEWSKGLETDTGSVIGADGSLFAIRREYHRPVPKGLFDDIFVSLSVLLAGKRVVRAPDLRSYETHATRSRDEFRRKVRISCECMAVHRELWPELRRLDPWNLYKYVGHRLLRWIGGCFLAASALCYFAAVAISFGLLPAVISAVLLGGLFAAAVKLDLPMAGSLWNVILAFVGNGIGSWKALHGDRAVTWEPPASAREGRLCAGEGVSR